MTMSLTERLSTLSLPELSRDDIARGLSGIPTPDLSGLERPNLELPDAILGLATAVGLKRTPPSRWPFALGAAALLVAGAFVALNRRAIKGQIDSTMVIVERQVAQLRSGRPADEPVAFTAASTAPIQPSDLTGGTGADYPDGLGNGVGPAFEEAPEPDTRSAEVAGV